MDSGFANRRSSEGGKAKKNCSLFHIKGTSEYNTKAVEVSTNTSVLLHSSRTLRA